MSLSTKWFLVGLFWFGVASCLEAVTLPQLKKQTALSVISRYESLVSKLQPGDTLILPPQKNEPRSKRRKVTLSSEVGAGSTGRVFLVEGNEEPKKVIKILKEPLAPELVRRLNYGEERKGLNKLRKAGLRASRVTYLSPDDSMLEKEFLAGEVFDSWLKSFEDHSLLENLNRMKSLQVLYRDLAAARLDLDDLHGGNLVYSDDEGWGIIDPGKVRSSDRPYYPRLLEGEFDFSFRLVKIALLRAQGKRKFNPDSDLDVQKALEMLGGLPPFPDGAFSFFHGLIPLSPEQTLIRRALLKEFEEIDGEYFPAPYSEEQLNKWSEFVVRKLQTTQSTRGFFDLLKRIEKIGAPLRAQEGLLNHFLLLKPSQSDFQKAVTRKILYRYQPTTVRETCPELYRLLIKSGSKE